MSGYSSYVTLYDANENQLAVQVGIATPVSTPALMSAGSDGTNPRYLLLDSSGRQIIIGPVANGAAVTGNPLLIAGSDGTNARNIRTAVDGAIRIDPTGTTSQPINDAGGSITIDGTITTIEKEYATFTALATNIDIGNNKSMFSIVNASGSLVVIKISAIYIVNVRTSATTGVTGIFELRRIVNHSGGTQISNIETFDSIDTLNGSITIRTGSTVNSESSNLLWRSVFSTDEWGPGTIDVESNDHIFQTMFPFLNRQDYSNKLITLRANQGLNIKFATNSTSGTFDIMVVFTQE